jgi:hypothetical protein
MENKIDKSQYFPIILVWFYIVLFFCIYNEAYLQIYDTIVVFIDTFLCSMSLLYWLSNGEKWGYVAKKSLYTALSLNVLTELTYIVDEMPNYYLYYSAIISIYLIFVFLYFLKRQKPQWFQKIY